MAALRYLRALPDHETISNRRKQFMQCCREPRRNIDDAPRNPARITQT